MKNSGKLNLSSSSRRKRVRFCRGLLLIGFILIQLTVWAEDARKLKSGSPPEYPKLARRLDLRGIARVQVTVTPDGSVNAVSEIGGNPIFLQALTGAVKKWKYEPAEKTSVFEVKFEFVPQ